MNLSPDFTRDPAFVAFKKEVNHPSALEFILNLGAVCQVKRTDTLRLPVEYVGATLGLPDQIEPAVARNALIKHQFIEAISDKEDMYLIKFFVEQNRQLIACWKSGALGGRPKDRPVSTLSPASRLKQVSKDTEDPDECPPF